MMPVRSALLAALAVAWAMSVCLGSASPAEAQKKGGTLTIVRPTDPVSLDPQLETTAPGAWVYFNMLEKETNSELNTMAAMKKEAILIPSGRSTTLAAVV